MDKPKQAKTRSTPRRTPRKVAPRKRAAARKQPATAVSDPVAAACSPAVLSDGLLLEYAEARLRIEEGDLLLWRPCNLFGLLIARYTDGEYSHIGSASWCGNVLESHDMLQWRGGQTTNLSALVRQYPRQCDVYRLPGFVGEPRHGFSQLQRRRAGEPYGWRRLAAIGLRVATHDTIRMPWRKALCEIDQAENPELWERLYRPPVNESVFCSEGVISDLRAVGIALLPFMAAWEVSPNAIAALAEYQFTLK